MGSNGQYSVVNLNVMDTAGLVEWAQMGSTLLSVWMWWTLLDWSSGLKWAVLCCQPECDGHCWIGRVGSNGQHSVVSSNPYGFSTVLAYLKAADISGLVKVMRAVFNIDLCWCSSNKAQAYLNVLDIAWLVWGEGVDQLRLLLMWFQQSASRPECGGYCLAGQWRGCWSTAALVAVVPIKRQPAWMWWTLLGRSKGRVLINFSCCRCGFTKAPACLIVVDIAWPVKGAHICKSIIRQPPLLLWFQHSASLPGCDWCCWTGQRVLRSQGLFVHLSSCWCGFSKVPAYLNVVDIAGLVKGAHEGKGLGNAFLSNINACDAMFHVVRMSLP